MSMNKNLIVEIFVPSPGTDCKSGEIATGYPVARNLILTARHPLYPNKSQYDQACKIEVRWRPPMFRERAGSLSKISPGISDWGFLSEQKPADTMQWVSAGFPRVGGKKDNTRKPFDMKGTVFSTLDTAERFPIETTAGPEDEEEWKGASGSPVFVNWRILGVIVSVPEKLKAKRLWAVSLWRVLREDKSFRAKLCYDEREARRNSIQQKLTAALAPAALAVDALAEQIPGCSEALVGEGVPKKAEVISESLLKLGVDQVIKACKKAHNQVKGSEPNVKAIANAVHIILPAIYDYGVVEAVRNARGEVNAALVALPAHYPTVAEIIMAGVDRREALFCPREREDEFPKDRLCLPEPPEGGFDSDGQRALQALDRHLTSKFRLESDKKFQEAVDEFMIHRFYQAVPGAPERTAEQKIEGAARELQYQLVGEPTPQQLDGGDPANGCLVLIDEIDKAETDVPNGLLEALGAACFTPPGRPKPVTATDKPPLVIITTNEERALPDPFLRRCLVLHLYLPADRESLIAHLVVRGQAHFPNADRTMLRHAAELLIQDRDTAKREHWLPLPGQAEYLDLVRAVIALSKADLHQPKRAPEVILAEVAGYVLEKHPDAFKRKQEGSG